MPGDVRLTTASTAPPAEPVDGNIAPVDQARARGSEPTNPSGARVFSTRFADNLSRRFWLFLAPVLLITAIGVLQVSRAIPVFESTGVLDAAANPYLESPDLAVGSVAQLDLDAEAISQLLNEQLGTDSFVIDIARAAGLGEQVENEDVTPVDVRRAISVSATGRDLVTVGARWADAAKSRQLVVAAIETFDEFLTRTIVAESAELSSEQQALLELRQSQADASTAEYDAYVASLAADTTDDLTTAERLRVDRLTERLRAATDAEDESLRLIDVLTNVGRQASDGSWQLIKVVDEPRVPTEPTDDLPPESLSIAGFVLLGLVIAIGAAVMTTALDRSISTPAHLASVTGIPVVVPVRPLRPREWSAVAPPAVDRELSRHDTGRGVPVDHDEIAV